MNKIDKIFELKKQLDDGDINLDKFLLLKQDIFSGNASLNPNLSKEHAYSNEDETILSVENEKVDNQKVKSEAANSSTINTQNRNSKKKNESRIIYFILSGILLIFVIGIVIWYAKSNQNTLAQNKAIMEKAIADSIALSENLIAQKERIENEENLLAQLRRDSAYISENEKAQANQDSLDSFSEETYLEGDQNSNEVVEQIPVDSDAMPIFYGGEEGLKRYFSSSIKYPQMEKDAGITGTVEVSFEINELGGVQNARVVRGVKGGPGLDKEALRIINNMPKWKAGKKNGSPAVIQLTLPIKFRLI